MRKYVSISLLVLLSFIFSGCAALRVLNPFDSVSAQDSEWTGVSGQAVSVLGSLDERAATVMQIMTAFGQGDPFGVILPVSLQGSPVQRWILCTDEYTAKCKQIPVNSVIHFAGRPIESGLLWKPTRLTVEGFND